MHDSKITRAALLGLGSRIRHHFLPPYCPDDNPIEREWEDLHANVTRNHTCVTITMLLREVRYHLRKRNRKRLKQHRRNGSIKRSAA